MREIGRRLKGSWLSILLFVFAIAIVLYTKSSLTTYLVDRIYPVKVDEYIWKSAFELYFRISLAVIIVVQLIWYLVIFTCNPEPVGMRKNWKIIMILQIVCGIATPAIFIYLYPISSGLFTFYIAMFFFLIYTLPFLLSTLINYPEIKYSSGMWALAGR